MIKRLLTSLIFALSLSTIHAEDGIPKVFAGLLSKDKPIKAQLGMVLPPVEMDKYVAKVAAAARKDQEWFKQYSDKSAPASLPRETRPHQGGVCRLHQALGSTRVQSQ